MQLPTIERIIPDSIAARAMLQAGWCLLKINQNDVHDIIDYQIAISDEVLHTEWLTPEGEHKHVTLEKAVDQDLGIEFSTLTLDRPISCKNHCLFCFVDQLPRGLRKSLYYKDDDYRLSFLSGSYITLSNTSWEDLKRIVELKLSPLYVSVHAWDQEVRQRLVRSQNDEFQEKFMFLIEHGIELHCQIVVCPEINDGTILEETVRRLLELAPQILSVALVPVGLTGHRERLYPLRLHDKAEAQELIRQISRWQEIAIEKIDSRLFWAADEFYLKAELPIPPVEFYENYPVLEDGVGLIRSFWDEWNKLYQGEQEAAKYKSIRITTGISGEVALKPIVEQLNQRLDLRVSLQAIRNDFFGSSVTVTGLVTGKDIIKQLVLDQEECVLLPGIMLRDGGDVFLDDTRIEDLDNAFPNQHFLWIEPTAAALHQAIFQPKRSKRKKMTVRRSI